MVLDNSCGYPDIPDSPQPEASGSWCIHQSAAEGFSTLVLPSTLFGKTNSTTEQENVHCASWMWIINCDLLQGLSWIVFIYIYIISFMVLFSGHELSIVEACAGPGMFQRINSAIPKPKWAILGSHAVSQRCWFRMRGTPDLWTSHLCAWLAPATASECGALHVH